jgi:hypothetical protein
MPFFDSYWPDLVRRLRGGSRRLALREAREGPWSEYLRVLRSRSGPLEYVKRPARALKTYASVSPRLGFCLRCSGRRRAGEV